MEYRDGLAHRIPLYIPPYTVLQKDVKAYNDLEKRKYEAILRGDENEYNKIKAKMSEKEKWAPQIMHSFSEKARPILFHAQMIVDMKTLFELCDAMCNALDDLVYTEG